MNKNILIIGGTSVLSLIVGGISGYFYTKNKLEHDYEARVTDAIEEIRNDYAKRHKTGAYATPESTFETFTGKRSKQEIPVAPPFEMPDVAEEDLRRAVHGLRYMSDIPEAERIQDIPVSEVNPDSDVDWENEVASRDSTIPHIISQAEFSACELNYNNPQLTYYAGDGVLLDSQGQQVHDIEDVVGGANLLRFGYMSNEEEIVYIRNNNLNLDFEVIREPGRFDERNVAVDDEVKIPSRRSYPRRQDRRT